MLQEVKIHSVPNNYECKDLGIERGLCHQNSFRVARKYPKTKIVEGVIIMIDKDNNAQAMAHVWNRIEDAHFDVTNDHIWIGKPEMEETKEIKYFPLIEYDADHFKDGDLFTFSKDTNFNVEVVNDMIKPKKDAEETN